MVVQLFMHRSTQCVICPKKVGGRVCEYTHTIHNILTQGRTVQRLDRTPNPLPNHTLDLNMNYYQKRLPINSNGIQIHFTRSYVVSTTKIIKIRQFSTSHSRPRVWNSMPVPLTSVPTLGIFNMKLKQYLVIRLIIFFAAIYCIQVYWVTHDSGISPFWFALYKLHNFLVNMSFVYTFSACNKMVLIDLLID